MNTHSARKGEGDVTEAGEDGCPCFEKLRLRQLSRRNELYKILLAKWISRKEIGRRIKKILIQLTFGKISKNNHRYVPRFNRRNVKQ